MNLVIVESPAKCKKIAEILGKTFQVLATMGHIRALEEDLDAVGIERDFEPRFRFLKEKTKATTPIMEAARQAKIIYLAADDDREGEAIAYSVACLLKRDPLSFPRSVFHEITPRAIKHAIENPRKIDMNRVYAQQARSMLDMMVGFTISPLLWKHVAIKLSAGRCQTPALRILHERETSIKDHTVQNTWSLSGKFQTNSLEFEAKLVDELEDKESSLNYMENVNATNSVTFVSNTKKPWTASPPKPFITSTLQQEVSALYKINPKETMKIAQRLYEAGHITYMRTDMAVLCEEAVKEAHELVTSKYGKEYTSLTQSSKKAQKAPSAQTAQTAQTAQNAQEAHEAIRPTHFDLEVLPESFSPIEKKLYSLIWKRALQSTMSSATGEELVLKMLVNPDTDFLWMATRKRTLFQGWQILGNLVNIDDSEEEADDSQTDWDRFSKIQKDSLILWNSLTASPKRSKASPRFTEATLVRELEKKGIGRPSTFASLVETLFDKLYVEKKDIPGIQVEQCILSTKPTKWPPIEKKSSVTIGGEKQKLVPTLLGKSVLDFCLKEFPHLFAFDFTAQMERRLDAISKGQEEWKQLCKDTWSSYKEAYARLKDIKSLPSKSEKVVYFGDGFKAVISRKGPLLLQEGKGDSKPTFYTIPSDTDITQLTKEKALELIQTPSVGEYNGVPIHKKKGPYGEYLEAGSLKLPWKEGMSMEEIIAAFALKEKSASSVVRVGPFIFKVGPYGPYMYKDGVKKKVFVSIPATINPKTLTEKEALALYTAKNSKKK